MSHPEGLDFGLYRRAWNRYTSATPDAWTPENSARGQSDVTALVVQDVLDGELLFTRIDGEPHYYNQLDDGGIIDLTYKQFGLPETVPPHGDEVVREEIIDDDLYRRYRLLLQRAADIAFVEFFLRIQ